MIKKYKKSVIQMTADKDEINVVKLIAAMEGISISDYVRKVVTEAVSKVKKTHAHPAIFGMREYDFNNLSAAEKEQFMNQIGPVVPNSLEYFLNVKKGLIDEDLGHLMTDNGLI